MSAVAKQPFRLAYFASHPIQYQAPLLRYLAADDHLDLTAFFYSDFSLRQHLDPGYGVEFKWDVPLVQGYKHEFLKRLGGGGALERKPWVPARGLKRLLRDGKFDAVWVHGWAHACSLQAMRAARSLGLPVLVRGESVPDRLSRSGRRSWLVRQCQRAVLRRAQAFLSIGANNCAFYAQNGVPPERLFLVPYAVDNEFFRRKAAEARPRREAQRSELSLEPGRTVILFAGRLAEVKAPDLLLEAISLLTKDFTRHAKLPHLLFVGDGPMRAELEEKAHVLPEGLVHFLGFRNQTELPALYDLCDLFVLPSRFEPWGLVVNEVMNAGRPMIVSDRVGAGPDLVQAGLNGWIYSHDDACALAGCLREALADPQRLQEMGRRSLERVRTWDFEADRRGLLEALATTCRASAAAEKVCAGQAT
jgi:glycosyltransferase involved in cell wall biosynthesis